VRLLRIQQQPGNVDIAVLQSPTDLRKMLGLPRIQQLLGNVDIAVPQSLTDLEKNDVAAQDTKAVGHHFIAPTCSVYY
jgi:hypothetical protein